MRPCTQLYTVNHYYDVKTLNMYLNRIIMENVFIQIFAHFNKSLTSIDFRCENGLMSFVNMKNCITFYQTALEIGAELLKGHCSELISNHWVCVHIYTCNWWYNSGWKVHVQKQFFSERDSLPSIFFFWTNKTCPQV